MKKYLLALLVAVILIAFVSCATKAPAEEAYEEPQVEETASEEEVPNSLIQFELSDDGKYLIVFVQYYPEEGWFWNPIYETEEDAQKMVWLESEYATGTYKFDEAEAELPAQRHIFQAAAPAQGVQFGLGYKQNGGERKAELVILVNIAEDLTIQVVDFKTGIV